MFCYHEWVYKGHICIIKPEYEEDNIKIWHTVITPEGKSLVADISPYLSSPDLIEMWIDAGYPSRIGGAPLDRETLEKIGPMPKLTALVKFGRVEP